MQNVDVQVIETTLEWLGAGDAVWLCTVLATYGSSPRCPGSMLAVRADGAHVGSLSGGCVEEDFLARLAAGAIPPAAGTLRYGEGGVDAPGVSLPCGGVLDVLVEYLRPGRDVIGHLRDVRRCLAGEVSLKREVSLATGRLAILADDVPDRRVSMAERAGEKRAILRMTPSIRLVICGLSPVSEYCADFACSLGFEVIVCDPREAACRAFPVEQAQVRCLLPSRYLSEEGCHASTAIVALTHDPRVDDLAMIEAVRTPAFYIGVMGSQRTSRQRAERLMRSGGLSTAQVARIRMPIGVDIGSRTPAQIALAVLADVLATHNGKGLASVDVEPAHTLCTSA